MKNNILVSLSIFCLGICFVIGCWLISNGLKEKQNPSMKHQLLTQAEVADYLGLSIEEVRKITEIPNGENSYTSEIPHIKIEDKIYYPQNAIDKWMLEMELIVLP